MIAVAAVLSWMMAGGAVVADDDLEQALERAQALYLEQHWNEAEAAWSQVVLLDPKNAEAWHKLGYSQHRMGLWEQAARSHREAAQVSEHGDTEIRLRAYYDLACCHAHLGQRSEAVRALELAVKAGLNNPEYLLADPDLNPLLEEDEFRLLILSMQANRRNVAILLHPGVSLLELAAPAEVFTTAYSPGKGRQFNVYTVAATEWPVTCGSVTVTPEYHFGNCPAPDIVVVPGGQVAIPPLKSLAVMRWIERVVPQAEAVISVGSGAVLLVDSMVENSDALHGKRIVTAPHVIEQLEREAPSIEVVRDRSFVDSGAVTSAANGTAAIDASLHLVGKLLGREALEATAQRLGRGVPSDSTGARRRKL